MACVSQSCPTLFDPNNGILVIDKEYNILFAVTWRELKIVILSESKSEKGKYCMISLIAKSEKRVQMNLFTKQKQTHGLQKQTYICQDGCGREE